MAVTFLTNEDKTNLEEQINSMAGADGADGKSAYEIALDNGFEGTEAEWLASLKGADGVNGEGSSSIITDTDTNTTASLSFEKSGENITAVITYPAGSGSGDNTGDAVDITLDSVAYETLTYRDIFITNNRSAIGDFESGLDGYTIKAGTPEITDEVYESPSYSLKCFGSSSQHTTHPVEIDAGYNYCAARVRIDRYGSGGGAGYSIGPTKSTLINYETNGFVTCSSLYESAGTTAEVYLGTITSADVDAYVDDFVLVNLGIFSTTPTKEQMDVLYENYISVLRGNGAAVSVLAVSEATATEERYVLETKKQTVDVSNTECINAFMDAVNKKAASLGMTSSSFITASGADQNSSSTARDLLRMTIEACGYKDITRIWGKNSKTITTKDSGKREVTVTTTVSSSVFESSYYLFGGKTGSLSGVYSLVVVGEIEDKMVAGAVMGATSSTNRFAAMKELFDIAAKVIADPTYDTSGDSVTNAASAIACVVPNHVFNYEQYDFIPLFEQEADSVILPASTVKVISAMTMLDYISNIHETITMTSNSNLFNSGEVISYEDALYAMLLPSSNETALAVARSVGKKILTEYT